MADSKQNQFAELRELYPVFEYCGYYISRRLRYLEIDYLFNIPGLCEFKPRWRIPIPKSLAEDLLDKILNEHDFENDPPDSVLNELIFSLGMTELVSYWKLTCSPEIRVNCGYLSQRQISWWKKLYEKGLGEFFYTNGIVTGESLMNITCGGGRQRSIRVNDSSAGNTPDGGKVLVPIGGGKDSAVTLELLKNTSDVYCYMINPGNAMNGTAKAGGIADENIIAARRTLDASMLALNKKGYLNGHTPFSAIVAFSSCLAAYIHGIGYVALSNEQSANEPTVSDSDVNHQYSKSFEFESDFIDYESEYVSSGVGYFSFLRPLTEIGISRIFSRFSKYHSVFRSCNAGSKTDSWCCSCPKCLFVYIMLAPFLPRDKMIGIFHKDMLDDGSLTPVFDKLIGLRPEKPFECVGSRDEVKAAMRALVNKYDAGDTVPPRLVSYYRNLAFSGDDNIWQLAAGYDDNNRLPERFAVILKEAIGNCLRRYK